VGDIVHARQKLEVWLLAGSFRLKNAGDARKCPARGATETEHMGGRKRGAGQDEVLGSSGSDRGVAAEIAGKLDLPEVQELKGRNVLRYTASNCAQGATAENTANER
jgi:hypothetical protein